MKAFALAAAIAVVFMTNPGQAQTRPDEFASGAYTVVSSNAWAPVYSNDVRSFAPSLLGGFDVEEGWRFNRYYAVEAGYALATGSSQYIRLTVQAVSLDALGYLPFGYHRKFALFGDVGVSELRGTASTSVYGLDVSELSNPSAPGSVVGFNSSSTRRSACARASAISSPTSRASKGPPSAPWDWCGIRGEAR